MTILIILAALLLTSCDLEARRAAERTAAAQQVAQQAAEKRKAQAIMEKEEAARREDQAFGAVTIGFGYPNSVSQINSRLNFSDSELLGCSPQSSPPNRPFAEYLVRYGSVSGSFLAVQLTEPLIQGAALKAMSESNVTADDVVRALSNAKRFLRSDMMTFAIYHRYGTNVNVTSESFNPGLFKDWCHRAEPMMWSESHGAGRLVWMSGNAVSGTGPRGIPMLLMFRRRVCSGDTSFSLRIHFSTQNCPYVTDFTFPAHDSMLALLARAPEEAPRAEMGTRTSQKPQILSDSIRDFLSLAEFAVSLIRLFV